MLAEFGFLGMGIPEAFGGLGLDLSTCLAATEELARGDGSVALSVSMQNGPVTSLLLAHASEDLQDELLPGIASGERLVAFALGELGAAGAEDAGAAIATPVGEGWRLDGRKIFACGSMYAGDELTAEAEGVFIRPSMPPA